MAAVAVAPVARASLAKAVEHAVVEAAPAGDVAAVVGAEQVGSASVAAGCVPNSAGAVAAAGPGAVWLHLQERVQAALVYHVARVAAATAAAVETHHRPSLAHPASHCRCRSRPAGARRKPHHSHSYPGLAPQSPQQRAVLVARAPAAAVHLTWARRAPRQLLGLRWCQGWEVQQRLRWRPPPRWQDRACPPALRHVLPAPILVLPMILSVLPAPLSVLPAPRHVLPVALVVGPGPAAVDPRPVAAAQRVLAGRLGDPQSGTERWPPVSRMAHGVCYRCLPRVGGELQHSTWGAGSRAALESTRDAERGETRSWLQRCKAGRCHSGLHVLICFVDCYPVTTEVVPG